MSKSASLHLETVYGQLCKEKSPHERIIQRDLARTFPRIEMFKQENGNGQISMKRILEAYSLYDSEVGYCQGLAFLVGPLLMNVSPIQLVPRWKLKCDVRCLRHNHFVSLLD